MAHSNKSVWLVTGSSSGLGRAVVTYLLEQGQMVVATLRKPTDISDLALKYSKDQLLVVKLDVTSPTEIKTAFSQAITQFGRVDVVYNNAGSGVIGEIEGTEDVLARRLFEINFWGSTNVALEAVRVFRDINTPAGGRLIQVSSMSGIQGAPGMGYYSASKHAVEGITQALLGELHPSWNIKITLLEPGKIRTPVLQGEGNMIVAPTHPAYSAADTPTTAIRQFFTQGAAFEGSSDVDKAAREIYKIALDDNVGMRVVLGPDAIAVVADQIEMLRRDNEASEKWSRDLKYEA